MADVAFTLFLGCWCLGLVAVGLLLRLAGLGARAARRELGRIRRPWEGS